VNWTAADNLNITLNDPECDSYEQNATHVWVKVMFAGCGSIISETGDLITQENTATLRVTNYDKNAIIKRESLHYYKMQCIFSRSRNVSVANGYETSVGVATNFTKTAKTTFEASMTIYDSTYSTPATTPYKVTSRQPIYIGIKEDNDNVNFKFVVQDCWATPGSNMMDAVQYMFFHKKCPLDDTYSMANQADHRYQFSIDAFSFIAVRKAVFIHCKLWVCLVNSTTPACTQECESNVGARKRRSIESRDGLEEEVSISSSKIVFEKKPTCAQLACPAFSSCVEAYPAQCLCNEGYVLHKKSGKCVQERQLQLIGLHFDMEFQSAYADTNSLQFKRFAAEMEEKLIGVLVKEAGEIEGVKVIGARPGSIVLDLVLIHSPKSTKKLAYDYFVSIMTVESDQSQALKAIKVKTQIVPTLGGGERKKEEEIMEKHNTLLIVCIAVAVAATMLGVLLVTVVRYRSMGASIEAKEVQTQQGVDNSGMVMERVA